MLPPASYRALIVEDDALSRGLAVQSLAEAGLSCDAASDGRRARQLLDERRYDVIVLDLVMPNCNGHALAVEALAMSPAPIVFVTTGVRSPKIVRDLVLRGVDEVVFKPVDYDLLAVKIIAILDRRHSPPHIQPALAANSPGPDQRCELALLPMTAPPVRSVAELAASDRLPRVAETELELRLQRMSCIQPISSAALEAHRLAANESVETSEVAEAIARDSSLSVQLIRLANSAAYNRSNRRITRLEDVVVQIGRRRVGETALAVSSLHALAGNRIPWMDRKLVWLRSLAAALAVRRIVPDGEGSVGTEGLFLGALLHLSGRIALATMYPKTYHFIVEQCRNGSATMRDKERECFPLTHPQAMSRLLARWNVPPEAFLPLEYLLHDKSVLDAIDPAIRRQTFLLSLAVLAGRLALGVWEPWDTVEFPLVGELAEFNVPPIGEIIDQVRDDLRDMIHVLAAFESAGFTSLPQPRVLDRWVAYRRPAEAGYDFLAAFAPATGVKLREDTSGASPKTGGTIINLLDGDVEPETDTADERRLYIVRHRSFAENRADGADRLELPARFGSIESRIRQIASIGAAVPNGWSSGN